MMWQAKTTSSGSYIDMKTPSAYSIDWEDLDSNSYRSITTGNLTRNIIGKKWFKGSFSYNYLTQSELESILNVINAYPLYVRIKSPLFGTSGYLECEAYVSKVSVDMQQNKTTGATWSSLSFNIVQSKKVSGQ